MFDILYNKTSKPIVTNELLDDFEAFKDLFNQSSLSAEALAEEIGGVDDRIISYAKTCKNGAMTTRGFSTSLEGMTLKAKAGQVALKGLSLVGNALAGIAVSFVVTGLIKGIDYLINREEKLKESLSDSIEAFESTTSEIKSLDEQVKTLGENIAELQKLKDAGTISIADDEELQKLKEENDELERQIALLQDKQIREANQVLKDAEKQEDDYVQSRYSLGNNVTPAEELWMGTQAYIYAVNSDNDALAKEHGERVVDMYEKIQPTLEAYRSLEEAGYTLSESEQKHFDELKKGEDAYLMYTYLTNNTKEAFVALNQEMQKSVMLRHLVMEKGMTEEQAGFVLNNIDPEDYEALYDTEFTPPALTDYATAEEYGKAYAEAWLSGIEENVQGSTLSNEIDVLSFSDLFNESSIDETKQKLLDLATSGELSSETITSTEEYKALLEQTTMSAQEFVDAIEKFNIDNLNASFEKYNDVLTRIRNGETLQAKEISELITEHEDLAGAVLISGNAYSIEEAALESIIDKYLEASNVAISHQLEQTKEVIEGIKTRLGFYGLEIEAMQRIANIANSYGTMKAVQFATGEYGYEIMPYVSDIISMAQQYSDAKNVLTSLSRQLEESIAGKAANENVAESINEDIDKYKSLNEIIDVNTSLIQSQINLLESKGETIGIAYYEELLNHSTQRLSLLTEQYSSLKQDLTNAMSNGIKKGSSEWLDMNNSILEVHNSIIETNSEMEKILNTIDQLHWNSFDKIKDAIEEISNEAGNLADLLDSDKLIASNGNLTNKALTQLALYAQQMEAAKYLITQYSSEIEYLNNEYARGSITTEEYNQKLQELNDGQWNSVDAYNASREAIISLRRDAIEEEINALEELYDLKKKALNLEKEQRDWEKTVAENENSISKLKLEISELANDNSVEGTKRRLELEAELEEAQTEWNEELYEHTLDEHEKSLDDELEYHKEALEATLDDEDALLTDSINMINQNSSTILSTMNQLSKEYGINISTALTEPFTHGAQALSNYSALFTQSSSAFSTQLNNIAAKIYDLQMKADTAALSIVNKFNSANGTLAEQINSSRAAIDELLTAMGKLPYIEDAATTKQAKYIHSSQKKNSVGYATGTKSATPGYHPTFEKGIEIIEKDGQLLIPYSGGEMVFNNEQLEKLWDISNSPADYILPNINLPDFSNILSNIPVARPKIKIEQNIDSLIHVDGDMTPSVLTQLNTDRSIMQRVKDLAMEGTVEAISSRGFRMR